MTDLYIIAAGKGSRMGGNIPKALVPITDKPCLTTTLQQIGGKFENVFIVTNIDVQDAWTVYYDDVTIKYPELLQNVFNIPIKSGLGDGHAVKWALYQAHDLAKSSKVKLSEDIVVCWGDVFFPNSEIIDELLAIEMAYNTSGVLPAVLEERPYVSLLTDESGNCDCADFSKYGETHPSGYHDQSVFRFKRSVLWEALGTLDDALWKGDKYITPGGELSMLYAFHYLYNTDRPAKVYETNYPTRSFNTPEEVAAIQMEIDIKWKTKFRS